MSRKYPAPLNKPQVLSQLQAVFGLLSMEGVWIKKHMATDKGGTPVGTWDSRACRFSLDGALLRIAYVTASSAMPAYDLLCWHVSPEVTTTLAKWNDAEGTNLVAVLTLLNSAIERLGGEPLPVYPTEED